MQLLLSILSIFPQTYSSISSFVQLYGYFAILILMLLEAMSFPVPSEVILPIAGYFAAKGAINFVIAFLVITFASFIGMAIDYYIAYFIGKDVVYKHLHIFRISKKNLEDFDIWFEKNGAFAVFISRFIPVVRGLINFPAGFALMSKKKFYSYSMLGATIWNIVLMLFGYYALGEANSIYLIMVEASIFAILLYIIYLIAMKYIRKKGKITH